MSVGRSDDRGSHGSNAAGIGICSIIHSGICPTIQVGRAENSVAVAHQMTWCFISEEGVSHLTRDPLSRRIGGNAVDSATSIPSINNSPWIRGAPHSGFSRFMAGSTSESRNQSADGTGGIKMSVRGAAIPATSRRDDQIRCLHFLSRRLSPMQMTFEQFLPVAATAASGSAADPRQKGS